MAHPTNKHNRILIKQRKRLIADGGSGNWLRVSAKNKIWFAKRNANRWQKKKREIPQKTLIRTPKLQGGEIDRNKLYRVSAKSNSIENAGEPFEHLEKIKPKKTKVGMHWEYVQKKAKRKVRLRF